MQSLPSQRAVAGDGLLHPVAWIAVALLVLNDHVLKQAYPSALTGKLSDVAGLVFFPLLLQALWELAERRVAARFAPSRRVLLTVTCATAVVFASIQLFPAAATSYRVGLGAVQWPFVAVLSLLGGLGLPPLTPVHLTQDPTDLLALPALLVPLWLGSRRAARG